MAITPRTSGSRTKASISWYRSTPALCPPTAPGILRIGGILLVNPSHGDAALASIDRRYRLAGVVVHRSGRYRVTVKDLETYLIPKQPIEVTAEMIHERGRGIAYTKPAFAYLFTRLE